MSARIAAFVVWAAVAACLAFWGLRLFVSPRGVPAQTQPVSVTSSQRGEILRLFAAAPEPTAGPSEPALAARFKLIGVMAPKKAEMGRQQGVALIAVDDKPPRAYRVGARVDNSLVLQSVAARSVVIGPPQGAAAVQLDLPLPAPPATGVLPPPPADGFLPSGVSKAAMPAAPVTSPPPGSMQPSPQAGQILVQPGNDATPAPIPADDPSNRR